jgi:GAF domain-containing protein
MMAVGVGALALMALGVAVALIAGENVLLPILSALIPMVVVSGAIWLLLQGRLREAIIVQIGGLWGAALFAMMSQGMLAGTLAVVFTGLAALALNRRQTLIVAGMYSLAILIAGIGQRVAANTPLEILLLQVVGLSIITLVGGAVAANLNDLIESYRDRAERFRRGIEAVAKGSVSMDKGIDQDDLLTHALSSLISELPVRLARLFLLDDTAKTALLKAAYPPSRETGQTFPLMFRTAVAQAVNTRSLYMGRSTTEEGRQLEISVPLLDAEDKVIGVLDCVTEPHFGEAEIIAIQAFSLGLVDAIGRADRQTSINLIAQTDNPALRVSQAITTAKDSDALLMVVRDGILPDCDHLSLIGVRFGPLGSPLSEVMASWDRNGLVSDLDFPEEVRRVVGSRTLAVQDINRLSDAEADLKEYARHILSVNSLCIVPLPSRDRTAGYLLAAHYRPHDYSEETIFLLQAVGAQIALVLENMTLLETLSAQSVRLGQANELNRALLGVKNLEEMSKALMTHLGREIGVSHLSLAVQGSEGGMLHILAEGGGQRAVLPRQRLAFSGSTGDALDMKTDFTGTSVKEALEKGEPVQLVNATSALRQNPWLKEAVNILLIQPLPGDGRTSGTLNIGSTRTEPYAAHELALFEQVAAGVAQALDSVQRMSRLQKSLEEATTLYSTSLAINAAQNMPEVFETALSEMQITSEATRLAFFLGGPDPRFGIEYVEEAAIWHNNLLEIPDVPLRYLLEEAPVLSQFPQSRANVVFNDIAQDQRLDTDIRAGYLNRGVTALMMIPVSTGATWLGAVFLEGNGGQTFEEDMTRICRNIADQTALAIDAQLLMDRSDAVARRERALREITDRIREAQSVDAVMEIAAEEMSSALGLPAELLREMSVRDSQRHRLRSEERELVESVSNQVALAIQNLNLLEDAQRLAIREQLINQISGSLQEAINVNDLMETAVRSLSLLLADYDITLRLAPDQAEALPQVEE